MRKPDVPACNDRLAADAAQEQLVHFSQFNASVCASPAPVYGQPLGPECPLLARKYGPEVADAVTLILRQSGFLSQLKLEQLV